MAIRQDVVVVSTEFVEFVMLFFDDTDNKDQLLAMLQEGGEAAMKGYQLFKDLPKEDRLKAGLLMADALAEVVKDEYLKFSDEI